MHLKNLFRNKLVLTALTGFIAINTYGQIPDPLIVTDNFSAINPAYTPFMKSRRISLYTMQYKRSSENDDFQSTFGKLQLDYPVKKWNSAFSINVSGFKIMSDVSEYELGVSYGYRLNLSEHISLAAGANLSVIEKNVYPMYYSNPENDENIQSRYLPLNLDAGVWLRLFKFGMGISMRHINKPHYTPLKIPINQHLFITLTYDQPIGNLVLTSTMHYLDAFSDFEERTYSLTEQVVIANKFIAGLSIAQKKSGSEAARIVLSPVIGLKLKDRFSFYVSGNRINSDDLIQKQKLTNLEAMFHYNF